MKLLQLTLACEDYGRTRALLDGRVKPEGLLYCKTDVYRESL